MSRCTRLVRSLLVTAGAAGLLAPTVAAAAPPKGKPPAVAKKTAPLKWKAIAEEGFKAEVPSDWERTERCEIGSRKRFAWTYQSPKRNFTFKIIVSPDRQRPLKSSLADAWKRAKRRLKASEVLKESVIKDGNREIAIILARALKTRRTNDYPYLVARLVSRTPGSKVKIGLQLEAHGDRIDDFQAMVARLVEKLVLDRPDLLFAAKK